MNHMPTEEETFIIPKWIPFLLIPVLVLLMVGSQVTPVDTKGKPVVLSPNVKAIQDYRQNFRAWHDNYGAIDQRSQAILTSPGSDLFAISQDGQGILEDTLSIIQAIQSAKTPTAAIPARDVLVEVGEGYFASSRAILEWVAAPTESNYQNALSALEIARIRLAEMENSQWLTR